jgi:superoxide dismutase
MVSAVVPLGEWLNETIVTELTQEREQSRLESEHASASFDLRAFASSQNRTMLMKFFLEQAFGPSEQGETTQRIIDRDFGGSEAFKRHWFKAAAEAATDWLVLALSFSDFRFHLFAIGKSGPFPFCISPVMCACFREDIVIRSGHPRIKFIELQWSQLHWNVVEQRLSCLEEPLALFEEPSECCPPPDRAKEGGS